MLKNLSISQLMQQMPHVVPNYCDKCGFKHAKEDLEIVSQELDKITLRLTCVNCNSTYMIQVQSPADGMLSARKVAAKSDISIGEMRKFVESETIDNEEILDVVLALKKVSKMEDFQTLFLEEDNRRLV